MNLIQLVWFQLPLLILKGIFLSQQQQVYTLMYTIPIPKSSESSTFDDVYSIRLNNRIQVLWSFFFVSCVYTTSFFLLQFKPDVYLRAVLMNFLRTLHVYIVCTHVFLYSLISYYFVSIFISIPNRFSNYTQVSHTQKSSF